jgi:hypothetical protein
MSFAIDSAKVEELLTSTQEAWPSHSDAGNLTPWYPSSTGRGIVYATPILITADSMEHLLSHRRKIEGAGIPLISSAELEAELREMRR